MKKIMVKSQLVFTQLPFVESYRYWLNTFIYTIFLCLSCTVSINASAVGWWNSDWSKCREITITNTGTSTLNNFPAYISLSYDSDMQSDLDDIRFINAACNNNGSELNFEFDSFIGTNTVGTNADIWVNLDSLPTEGKTIAVYYGNASVASGEDVNNTWDNNHQGVWHLREDTGSTNQDSTSNLNNGKPKKNPASTTGKIGNALNFDVGNESYIEVGKANSLNLSSDNYSNWTISLWVKPADNFQSIKYPVMYTYGDYGASFGLAKENGKMESWRNNSDPIYSNNSVSTGSWNHVVITRTPTDTTFYLNGISNGSSLSANIKQSTKGSFIGGYKKFKDGDLKGVIDEVRVSNVSRSADWIKQSYQLVENQNSYISIGVEVEQVADSSLTGNLSVDNTFEAYISSDDSVQGTLITSGTNWKTTYNLATLLTPGQAYYLHIKAVDTSGAAGFLGDFEITDSDHTFSNGLTTLNTNTTNWVVSKAGWSDYQPVSAYGTNGADPWGTRASVDNNAQWIWSSDNVADNLNYFSTKILPTYTCSAVSTLNAVGIKINSGGSDSEIGTTTEALNIYAAWLAAGSPTSGLIDSGTYNIAASGSSTVDRIDFGGDEHDYSGTLPYPGAGVGGENFLVHASGTLSLPAGDYTIYVEADDGFSFTLDTLSGETVSFNKFGKSNAGESNELRYETITGNSNIGGSFTLTQDSVFDIAAIFFERSGDDYLEISIANDIRTSRAPTTGYEILSDGALSDKVKFGQCAVTSLIDHYEISHDGSGLTCATESVTVKACANTACDIVMSTDVSVTLTTTGAVSTWSQNPVTIPGGSTLGIEVDLTHTTAETVTLGATSSPVAPNSLVCNSSGNSCDIVFADSGYLLTLANHQSCTTSNLTIQAVKLSDTGVNCAPAYTGDQLVDFIFDYTNPTSGTKVPTLDGSDMALATVAQNRTVSFDGTATANLSFNYQDAGQISIGVNDTTSAGLASSSLNTVVSPTKLIVASASADAGSVCTSAEPNDPLCTVFKKAGETFNLNVSAACSDNTVTPNFEMNNIPLTVSTVAPSPANSVALGVSSINIVDTDNGIHTEPNQTVSEVGVFTITATPLVNGYFGETIAPATSANIGRFSPSHFELTTTFEGAFNGGNPFVYTGQMSATTPTNGAISYAIEPEFTITAKSALCSAGVCATTRNYTGNFVKMQAADIVRVTPTSDTTQLGEDVVNKVNLTANLNAVTLTESTGVITYQFNSSDNFVYTRNINAIIAPFSANIGLQITSITDDDGITANDSDTDGFNGVLTLQPFGEEIRFGRWYLESSFGPETSPINMPMATQYWNGNSFAINTSDSFTTFNVSDSTISDISLAPATTSASGSGTFAGGETKTVVLSSPGTDKQGAVTFGFTVPLWLQFDWDNTDNNFDGPYDDDPLATATFGIYRGNDRIIYMGEVFN
ncbi:MAG: DUF2341 domain-containing protein [Alteromonadaceae bacterium]